jgi:hypothetical protein
LAAVFLAAVFLAVVFLAAVFLAGVDLVVAMVGRVLRRVCKRPVGRLRTT